ncbi:MAG: glycosyltransferase family 4 protein [Elainellaceae cyanobacterium]
MALSQKLVVHVADIHVSEESGMGRIAWHWKNELERRGYDYVHIGPHEVGELPHSALFPYAAYRTYQKLGRTATFFLVHEASSSFFLNRNSPAAIFSHGLDRRSWELGLQRGRQVSWKTRILFPIWRLRPCDQGVKRADTLLFSNYEDVEFAHSFYHRDSGDIFVFRNGVYPLDLDETQQPGDRITVSFLATWLERKGIYTLIEAAKILHRNGFKIHWLLAGTGGDRDSILNEWDDDLRDSVEVLPKFPRNAESDILARSNIFALPSFFEGQPLSLLQAMEAGRCCITTDCCGQRDLIQHGENGLLHDPGDAKTLAALIESCITDETLRLKLGRQAKAYVQDRRWEAVSAEVVDRIEQHLAIH